MPSMGWGERVTRAATGTTGIRVLLGVLLTAVALKLAAEIFFFGTRVRCWDTMLLSGTTVFAVAVALALSLPRRFEHTLTELRVHGALPLTVSETLEIKSDLEQSGGRMVVRAAIIVGVLVLGGFLYVLVPQLVAVWQDPSPAARRRLRRRRLFRVPHARVRRLRLRRRRVLGPRGELRVASRGGLSRPGSRLTLQPGHYDGANGLAPIGSLYLYQALLVMFPIVWLAAWWLVIPYYNTTTCGTGIDYPYLNWRVPLLLLVDHVGRLSLSGVRAPRRAAEAPHHGRA